MNDGDDKLAQWSEGFIQGVINDAESSEEGALKEEVFTAHALELLNELGVTEDAQVCAYQAKGLKVSGYGFSQDDRTLDLIVTHCEWTQSPVRVPRATAAMAAKSCRSFLEKCLDGYSREMDESTEAFDLAQKIAANGEELDSVRIIVLTDGIVPGDPLDDTMAGEIEVSHQIWDIERLYRCDSSGGKDEAITIDFRDFGSPIACQSEADSAGVYTSYVAIVPGSTLGAIYEKWGTRLLEKNVRSFLQARGKVNQGIRSTILQEPNMFLTYNNGISVTASGLETEKLGDGSVAISRATDFQIVNGGQTIASLYHAHRKDKADLSAIRVAMKLTVIHASDRVDGIVAAVSRYANTQNKVNLADFAANDPFHWQVQEFSRNVWAPDPSGGKRLTHWFYERARGQFADDRSRSGSERTFLANNPKEQVFTKTDLAKFENTWDQLPHLVSRGAQKNFAEFSISLRERGGFKADQTYFENLVAKAILFRAAEKVVAAQHVKGYRANIVTYALALISNLSGQRIDLHAIWEKQGLSESLKAEIDRLAPKVRAHILESGGQNVTEWCKKEDCWKSLKESGLSLSPKLTLELLPLDGSRRVSSRPPRAMAEDAEDSALIAKATAIPAEVWLEMSHWGKQTRGLQPRQNGIVYSVGSWIRSGKRITGKMARRGLEAYDLASRKGFRPKPEGS